MPVYIDIVPQRPNSASSARQICNIDPTVTFVSPSLVHGKSSYIVLLDGAPVHSEDTMLEYVGPYFTSSTGRSSGNGPVVYNTPLVPKYWEVLCKAADPTLYTIVQDVYHVPDPVPNQDYAHRPRPVRIFSAIYHFQYPSSPDSGATFGQPHANVSSSGSSMTSGFPQPTVQGAMPMATPSPSFQMPSTHTASTAEVDQSLFDEPFMLDVNIQQLAFDDFVASMDNPNTFFM
jgi:transcriptional enhancer factor